MTDKTATRTAELEAAFATANATLLAPYSLDHNALQQVFGQILAHKVDYADLYFQYSRSEGWSLEEGIVKSGSFNIDQGVGVRAVAGEKTAFAYSDDISLTALTAAAQATRAIARQGAVGAAQVAKRGSGRNLYARQDPLQSLDDAAKVALLENIERRARALDPRVTQVMASLGGEYEVVLVTRSDGVTAADVRPLVRMSLQVIVEQDGRREQGSAGGGGRFDYAYFTDAILQDYAQKAVSQALTNLDARPAPAGSMTVVLGPGWPGVLLHEAIGHGLEGDFNRKGSSAFSGRIGERVAAPGVTVVDDGTIPQRRGSLNIDDEGNPDAAQRADRRRRAQELHAGQPERAPDGRAGHRQRPARIVRAHPDAAHDQYLHAQRRQGSAGDHRIGQARALCGQLSAADRSTSRAANSCSRRPKPT